MYRAAALIAPVLALVLAPSAAAPELPKVHPKARGSFSSLLMWHDVVPRKNSTRAMVPSLSLAVALTVTVLPVATDAPLAGEVRVTLGGWLPPVPHAPRSWYQPQLVQWVGGAFQIWIFASYRRLWYTSRSPGL